MTSARFPNTSQHKEAIIDGIAEIQNRSPGDQQLEEDMDMINPYGGNDLGRLHEDRSEALQALRDGILRGITKRMSPHDVRGVFAMTSGAEAKKKIKQFEVAAARVGADYLVLFLA